VSSVPDLDAETAAASSEPRVDELGTNASDRFARLVSAGEIVLFGEPTGQPVALEQADASWPQQFLTLRTRLDSALGVIAVRIEHVGSTAVPGLDAKPTIDIQLSVPDVDDEGAYRPAIEALGFPMRSREPGHRYLRTPKGAERRVHIHVCSAGSDWERDHLLFRDYLRAHSAAARRYAELKRDLAARYRDDRLAYTEGKTPFIDATLTAAKRWADQTGWRP
jgi:GrpB-like predicted nucleotidyltransferase (UPF0157 family)